MPDRCVATTGSNTAPYDTWATAAQAYATAAAAAAAGENIYLDSTHSEAGSAGQTIAHTNGTLLAPIRAYSVTPSGASGFSAITPGAMIRSNTSTFLITGIAHMEGITFRSDYTGGSTDLRFCNSATSMLWLKDCTFIHTFGSTSSHLSFGYGGAASAAPRAYLKNCTYKPFQVAQSIQVDCLLEFDGFVIDGSVSSLTNIFTIGTGNRGGMVNGRGLNFSSNGSGTVVVGGGGNLQNLMLRNCKAPASWTGILGTTPTAAMTKWEMHNYAVGTQDVNYRFITTECFGTCVEDIGVYKNSGGADDTPRSWSIKMKTANNATGYPSHVLRSLPLSQRVTAAPGTSKTVTVSILHDDSTAALTDKEVWLELEYFGTSGSCVPLYATDMQTILTAAAAQASDGATWTGATGTGPNGSTTWRTIKAHITGITFEESGTIVGRICQAKTGASGYTIYVDPVLVIT